jgi:selenocysteine lyase/cysteine desulfurase
MRMLTELGVERIQAWRQPLLQRLQQEMPRLGFAPMTREGSTAPIVSFAYQDAARKLRPRLDAAGVNVQLYQHRVRISPSFYNDMGDIDRLLAALA